MNLAKVIWKNDKVTLGIYTKWEMWDNSLITTTSGSPVWITSTGTTYPSPYPPQVFPAKPMQPIWISRQNQGIHQPLAPAYPQRIGPKTTGLHSSTMNSASHNDLIVRLTHNESGNILWEYNDMHWAIRQAISILKIPGKKGQLYYSISPKLEKRIVETFILQYLLKVK